MSGFAEFCFETHCVHETLVILLPDRASVRCTSDHNTFHVVSKDVTGNAHHLESMQHAYKQVFLPGVGKELDVTHAAVMADHDEAGKSVSAASAGLYINKAPVHLVTVASRS